MDIIATAIMALIAVVAIGAALGHMRTERRREWLRRRIGAR